ncbi:hypothetical protein HA464_11120 [Rhizobium leguminosarum bv. trifolii]|jgi:hypothetical protein|uniref:Uncharacterized protein n=2 Tax=Rhizobium ruizarguesonis TaxID=2081791 RepID=A0AAE4YS69_9HYPH|nr:MULTISPECIES: hypothetical protein [Rhizobium]QIO44505.1 hypothetical protein HA464_11120 [Rhizobium leguminosarum bv. trifolii]MBC2802830.1 hypothetical protein [Rhizobium ruizarguesonis]MBY5404048.1 hypothetical protein [Rhizobium leguminosarum]MBY5883645.1 hypothetical protein [Rhizobium leguminosarum]MCB2405773.1 hypothetical protein [Rhizobium ruizarguesonis]
MDMNFRVKNPSGSLRVEGYTLSAVLKADLDRYGNQQQCCERGHQTKRAAGTTPSVGQVIAPEAGIFETRGGR